MTDHIHDLQALSLELPNCAIQSEFQFKHQAQSSHVPAPQQHLEFQHQCQTPRKMLQHQQSAQKRTWLFKHQPRAPLSQPSHQQPHHRLSSLELLAKSKPPRCLQLSLPLPQSCRLLKSAGLCWPLIRFHQCSWNIKL